MMIELTPLRRQQIAEGLGDLEALFFDPGVFGDCTVADAAQTLRSEFDVGPHKDDEIVGRLDNLAAAELLGDLKAARRHLTFVRRKLLSRFGVSPITSEPVQEQCWSADKQSYVRHPGSDEVDASVLLGVLFGYEDPKNARLRSTVDAVRRELASGPYTLRYRGQDGLEGTEGAFLTCSFWLVEALALQ